MPSAPAIEWPMRSLRKRHRVSTTWRCRHSTTCRRDRLERQRVTLHRRRARAFSNLGQWANQRAALEVALEHLQPDQTEERCEMLIDLGQALFWLFDIPTLERVSEEALKLADALGRSDVAAIAMGWLARCRQAGGNVLDALDRDRETIERFGTAARISHSLGSIVLYWAGRGNHAVAAAAQATRMADTCAMRPSRCTRCRTPHWRSRRSADMPRRSGSSRRRGPLAESTAWCRCSRAGSRCRPATFRPRGLRHRRANPAEARELARGVNFSPTVVSPKIDLLLIAARRHDPGSVERCSPKRSRPRGRIRDGTAGCGPCA